jgi:hypothetical protein
MGQRRGVNSSHAGADNKCVDIDGVRHVSGVRQEVWLGIYMPDTINIDAFVVGAGVGGIYSTYRLSRMGLSVKCASILMVSGMSQVSDKKCGWGYIAKMT